MYQTACYPIRFTIILAGVIALGSPASSEAGLGPAQLLAQQLAEQPTPEQLAQLEFRHIGPVGNRISAVHGVEGDPLTYYAGAAAGGLWKTVDGGLYWEPVFDNQDVHSIGSIAVSSSDPEIIWAGTGEPHIRSNVTIGDGVYKSTDGGDTFTKNDASLSGRVLIAVTEADPEIVIASFTLGSSSGPFVHPGNATNKKTANKNHTAQI